MADPVLITASIIHSSLSRDGKASALPLVERAKACFKAADGHDCGFMLTSDDMQFRAGCGALMMLSDGEERERIETELRMLEGLSAAMRGLPIDMTRLVPEGFEPIGLMGIYRERDET